MLFVVSYFAAAIGVGLLLTGRLFGGQPLRYRLIAVVVLAQTAVLLPVHVVAALELVGLIDRVGAVYLAIGQAVLFCGALVCCRRYRPKPVVSAGQATSWACPGYLRLVAVALGGAYLIGAANALTSYIREFDAARYHLLLPLRWAIDGSFSINSTTRWSMSMPANAEASMFVIFTSGLEHFLSVVQWGPLLCLAASVYCLALSLSKSRDAAWMCVATLLTIPIIYFQSFSGYVDMFAVSFIAAAMAFGERSLVRQDEAVELRWRWLAMAGLACGIAIGTKHIYLAFGGMLCLALVGLHARKSIRMLSAGSWAAVTLLCGVAIPSAFWYLRALLLTGNLLYPLGITIGDYVLFDGVSANEINAPNWAIGRWVNSEAGWLVYPWLEYQASGSMTKYSVDSGLGAVVATFVPLGMLFILWQARRRRTDGTLWFWLAAWVVCGLIWWFPFHQTLRFGVVSVVLSVVMTAPLLATLSAVRGRLFRGLFCASTVIACGVMTLEPASLIASRVIFDLWSRPQIYRYPTAIDEVPEGTTILSFEATRNIAMAGTRLNHRVVDRAELPDPLTDEALMEFGIDLLVGRARHRRRVENLSVIELVHKENLVDLVAGGTERWFIWEVNRDE